MRLGPNRDGVRAVAAIGVAVAASGVMYGAGIWGLWLWLH